MCVCQLCEALSLGLNNEQILLLFMLTVLINCKLQPWKQSERRLINDDDDESDLNFDFLDRDSGRQCSREDQSSVQSDASRPQ